MRISKEVAGKMLSVYQPSEEEKERIGEVSDKIIDMMDEHKLTDDEKIHLVSSLYESMKDVYNIEKMMHGSEVPSTEEAK